MVKGIGSPDHSCMEEEVRTLLEEGTPVRLFDRKRVLVLTPDATRTCPLPMMIRSVVDVIGARAAKKASPESEPSRKKKLKTSLRAAGPLDPCSRNRDL